MILLSYKRNLWKIIVKNKDPSFTNFLSKNNPETDHLNLR